MGDNAASIRAVLVSGKAEELDSDDDGPGAIRHPSWAAGKFGVLGSVADATSRPRDNSGMSERWRTEFIMRGGFDHSLMKSAPRQQNLRAQGANARTSRAWEMHENMLWLRQLGLQVPSQADVETSLARPGPSVRPPAAASRAPPAPNARQPLYPKHVCDIEFFSIHGRRRGDPEAAKGEDGEYPPPPRTDGGRRPHARPRVRDRRVGPAGGLRPRHGHLEPPPVDEHTAKYTACIDKAGRTMEHDGRARGARRRLRVRETPVGGQLIEENARCLLPHAPRC